MYFILLQRPLLGGCFLGMAIGCRITSSVMLIPFIFILIHRESGINIKSLILFYCASLITGAVMFVPVGLRYGTGFLVYYQGAYPDILRIGYKASIGVWGTFGSLVLLFAIIKSVFTLPPRNYEPHNNSSIPRSSISAWLILSWFLIILIYVGLYLRLPYESGYLIPIVPFVILLLSILADRKVFIVFCIFLILSSFILTTEKSGLKFAGPVVVDHKNRIEVTKLIEKTLIYVQSSNEKSVIIAGYYMSIVEAYTFGQTEPNTIFVYTLNIDQIKKYRSEGYKLYYLPKQREENISVLGVDPQNYGVLPIEPSLK